MTRFVKAGVAAALALAAGNASAQILNALDRQAGIPAGLALPVPGAAVAEEPAALGVNPAAVGFVELPAIQYFHEGGVTLGSLADGLYGATAVGPFGFGYSSEWVRPGEATPGKYRRGVLALSLGDHRAFSLGFGWDTYWSDDPMLQSFGGWSAGLTARPARWLSLAAVTSDRDFWVGGVKQAARYDLGVATRLKGDALTLSFDFLADDRARNDFQPTHLAFGIAVEVWSGAALGGQLLVPVHDEPGVSSKPSFVATIGWNAAHSGLSGGVATTPARTGWLAGVRASTERYPAPGIGWSAPHVDVGRELSPDRIPFFDLGEPDPYGLLLRRLWDLADDAAVPAVVVRIDDLPLGAGRIEELRAALVRIGAKKPVVAYLTGGKTKEYWLATAATAVAMPPGTTLEVTGFATSNLYLREALGRVGIAFEVVAAGAYKAAPEPLVRDAPSDPAKENIESILDDRYARFVADVSAARTLSPDRVRALVDEALFSSKEAKDAGLVDAVIWPDEVEKLATTAAGRALTVGGPYRPAPLRVARRWGRPPVVAVLRVEGAIVPGRSTKGLFTAAGSETIVAQLRAAAADPEVKAIVLRVDSPGGDGLASDLIWRAVRKAREKKPVIASMGDVAASGGYFAAAGADLVVAEPSTFTGSIGVFVLKPELSGLLAKLGVHRAAFARGELAQVEAMTKPWSDKERRAIEKQIKEFYDLFLDRVAEGRKLPRSQVEAAAGGRVWTGRQALERGLVDRLGSLDDAITAATERAGLDRGDVEVRRWTSGGGDLLSGAMARASAGPLERTLASVPEVQALAALAEMGTVLALPVEWVSPVR